MPIDLETAKQTGRDANTRRPRRSTRRRSGLVTRATLVAVSLISLSLSFLPTARAELAEVALTIDNQDASPLRCVAVLAHFVSRDLPALAPGERTTLVMLRDSADGSLSLGGHDGQRMMVENLLCGRVGAWTATRGEVPILPIRATTAQVLETRCRIDERLSCSRPLASTGD